MAKRRPPIAGGYAPAVVSATMPAEANGQFDAKALLTALKTLKKGDFSVRLPVTETVIGAAIAEAFNDLAELLERDTQETARIGTVVGKEGRISQRANPGAATGAWAARIESINTLTRDLVQPTEEVARVIGAVAKGDLSPRIPLEHEGTPLKGEFLRIATTVNTMVDQLNRFAGEVTRVAREVGTEGKLGGQADVKGVAGTWKDLTDSVNSMAGNLTGQVRNIADVTTAVANGDLSKKITVDVKGEILQLKDTINTMVDQLRSFAAEVTRVAREVGTEGKLGGQADVKDVAGTWKDLTDSVNFMAGNLTGQVRNIADVTKAVATGDLSKKITVDVKGEILELKNTVNTMVDQLGSFASEVTRVAREVGTEGKLGGQADVKGVAGTWKDLTDSVNFMAGNLTAQVRNIADVTKAVANGDLSKKITVDVKGEILELKNTVNTMVDQLNSFASEVTRVAREVGTEGKLGGQAKVEGVAGTWKDLTDNVNLMAGNLTGQVRNIAEVTTAVANGNLTKKVAVDVRGEILELKNTINAMVDQLNSFASEVTRVAREVGTEGQLGGQAQVRGVAGVWKDLTDSVNSMAGNLTAQVRGIAKVVTAVANGDLKRKLIVEAKGEIASLADTINEMTDTLATFAEQVTSVAREVGVEGQLGGQAKVPGAAGTWKMLTENVNQLAANLTTQVRAIAEVATAVTKGDLTRSITVEALGEVAALKDNINEMIRNLKDTTQKNTEQDWLKTNLAKFTRMLQGQRDLMTVTKLILSELAPVVLAQHGVFYLMDQSDSIPALRLTSTYAYRERKGLHNSFRVGDGLVGQCAYEKDRILISNVPDDYIRISSGLGEATPLSIVVLPVIFEGEVKAVIELASFHSFKEIHLSLLDQITETIAIVLNTIEANMRTESLLKQSQSLAGELTAQQDELKETNTRLERQAATLRASEELLKQQQDELRRANEELETKAVQLTTQKTQVEGKNREIELAKLAVQEKAEQLELTSKYKSEFLANMSHELRTPLNSLLILSEMLAENAPGKSFAEAAGVRSDDPRGGLRPPLADQRRAGHGQDRVRNDGDRSRCLPVRRPPGIRRAHVPRMAQTKGLMLGVHLAAGLPAAITTDSRRLQQVLRNLLSNACKFTEKGRVDMRIEPATHGWSVDHPTLSRAGSVVALSVTDTGLGIAADKLRIIFEPFQQADTGTGRLYGGTGLGLSISREIARLLGGEIRVRSTPGEGSTFTLWLPLAYLPPVQRPPASPGEAGPADAGYGQLDAPPRAAPLYQGDGGRSAGAPAIPQMDVGGDRDDLESGDRLLLIVEHDPKFASILLEMAHQMGFKGLITSRGEMALELAQSTHPAAITLDLRLPDMAGWVVLDRLKHHPSTSHIPVHVISGDESSHRGVKRGAFAALQKPVDQKSLNQAFANLQKFLERGIKSLLVIEDNEIERRNILDSIAHDDVRVTPAATGAEGLAALKTQRFDCVVLDLGLPDMHGLDLIESIRKDPAFHNLPVIVYTGRDLTPLEQARVETLAESVITKDARSMDRLLSETALFLHRVEKDLEPAVKEAMNHFRQSGEGIANKKILIVDDDVRNIFALTSMLEHWEMNVLRAENGREALGILGKSPDVDAVLMDIMMPEMDGYQTTRAIRELPQFRELPIIALTAKALKDDRRKCLDAGASDYIAKPVQGEQLRSLLRVWLDRQR